MTIASDDITAPAAEPRPAALAALPWSRLYYWSVRRELWENRAIYMATVIAAGVVLLGVLISVVHPPHLMQTVRQGSMVTHRPFVIPAVAPYIFATLVITVTGLVTGVFYSLGALHNERRDRSILFWKSLPVSDLVTVLSKATLPLVVLPLVTFAVIVATQLVMVILGLVFALVHGQDAGALFTQVPLLNIWGLLFYGLVTLALWQAPVWGWLLLVSAWAKRTTFLWAVGPAVGACVVERLAFGTSYLWSLLQYRVTGGLAVAFTDAPGAHANTLPMIDAGKFLSTPGLWVGLVFAVAFIAAAIWLRRRREPI